MAQRPRSELGSHILTMRTIPFAGGQNTGHVRGLCTIGETWNPEQEFEFVRLVFANTTSRTLHVGPVAIAATASPDRNPVDAAGHPAVMHGVTFNNQGRDVGIALQLTAEPNVTNHPAPEWARVGHDGARAWQLAMPARQLPAGLAWSWVPDLYYSDWIPLRSVPRKDLGPGVLLHIRSVIQYGRAFDGPAYREDHAGSLMPGGRIHEIFRDEGDAVSSFVPMTGPEIGSGAVYAVQILSPRRGYVVQGVGDSIVQGVGGRSDVLSFAALAASYASTPARPVSWLQSATGGSASLASFQAAHRDLDAGHVSVALIQTWSGNDFIYDMTPAEAQAAADRSWQCAIAYGHEVRRRGGVPLFLTAVPQRIRTKDPALDATRLTSVTRCQALARHGEHVLDLNALLGERGADGVVDYRPEYSDDRFHPNARGHEMLAQALTPILSALLTE